MANFNFNLNLTDAELAAGISGHKPPELLHSLLIDEDRKTAVIYRGKARVARES